MGNPSKLGANIRFWTTKSMGRTTYGLDDFMEGGSRVNGTTIEEPIEISQQPAT
jgi:hypothetical protein